MRILASSLLLKIWLEKYKVYSCHPHLIEQHSGKNQIIKLLSDNEASGFWSLSYSLIDTLKNFSLNITGTYEDLYVLDDNKNWLIKKTIFKKKKQSIQIIVFRALLKSKDC